MKLLPGLATRDRIVDAVLVVSSSILQAGALAVAAFATRDAFAALHAGNTLTVQTMAQLALSGIVAALCLLVSRYRAEALGQSYAISLRQLLYRKIARLPKSRHEERRLGSLSLRFVGDLSAARLWFGRGLPDVWSAAVVIPGAAAILYVLNPELAIIGVSALGLSLAVMAALAWHLERRHRTLRRRRASIAISMIERIAIAPELDLMGRTDRELRRLNTQGASLRNDAMARRGRTAGLLATLQLGVAFAGLVVLWQAGQTGIAPATVAACLSVIALVAYPLQRLSSAWDQYCAWRVAREKAERLLSEPEVLRLAAPCIGLKTIEVTGEVDQTPIAFIADHGTVSALTGQHALTIARCIAGLDRCADVYVSFGGQDIPPKVAFIGDDHIGLQGSLRRSASLMCRKRPGDRRISKVIRCFGLSDLLSEPRGLDQRLAENGSGLLPHQTLRLDLTRAVLGKADVIVIASVRWALCQSYQSELLATLRTLSSATIIVVAEAVPGHREENSKVV